MYLLGRFYVCPPYPKAPEKHKTSSHFPDSLQSKGDGVAPEGDSYRVELCGRVSLVFIGRAWKAPCGKQDLCFQRIFKVRDELNGWKGSVGTITEGCTPQAKPQK